MPPRKSARAAANKGQSTLAFNHRVTKSVPKSTKDSILSTSVTKKAESANADVQDVEPVEIKQPELTQQEKKAAIPDKSDFEVKAQKITDAQIKRYWKGMEAQRISKRVHQEELSLGEKVLRYFDVSSQYGPCIGIPRTRRWQRAQKMGLNPPIEVLAVLLKEEEDGNKDIQRAAMDSIMGSTAVGAI